MSTDRRALGRPPRYDGHPYGDDSGTKGLKRLKISRWDCSGDPRNPFALNHCYSARATVPSDHLDTEMMNSVIGCGEY
jgi:hypothetical protein